MSDTRQAHWKETEVTSPHLDKPVSVVAVKDLPYVPNANRLQNLNIYLQTTPETRKLIGQPVTSLPIATTSSPIPHFQVHIHGGAWRDPQLTSSSIEAAVAHAFSAEQGAHSITLIASINYTVSPFPTHPTLPYDPVRNNHSDPAREALHPMHVQDVLCALALLRNLGLTDDSYILSGHSAGACLATQSTLQPPSHWHLKDIARPPRPAALLGMNGLYDLPDLVHNLGTSHAHLGPVYADLQGIAFGTDQSAWVAASPTRVDPVELAKRVQEGEAPNFFMLDQSTEDQLVPLNQTEKLQAVLTQVPGVNVVRGHRCVGKHAAPWEEGYMIWQNVQDVLKLLSEQQQGLQ